MNQRNVFTAIAVLLGLQALFFYTGAARIAAQMYPGLAAAAVEAVADHNRLVGVLALAVALITIAARNTPQVLWAYALGFVLIGANGLKDIVAGLAVPWPAVVVQISIGLLCGWLWLRSRSRPSQ